jgi:polyphosphate glucokinase
MSQLDPEEKILAIDIGGSRVKGAILDREGTMLTDYKKLDTPLPAIPDRVLPVIQELAEYFKTFTRVSVGFPGYVKNGVVYTAENLHTAKWKNFDLSKELSVLLKRPTRVVNDADFHGLGIVKGEGLEMVVTLGTGFGTALFMDGKLLPHLEIAHHPIADKKSYDEYIGDRALLEIGLEAWNARMVKVISIMKTVFNYDRLYLGGGNAKKISFKTDDNIVFVSNLDGIKGGARLWHDEYTSMD